MSWPRIWHQGVGRAHTRALSSPLRHSVVKRPRLSSVRPWDQPVSFDTTSHRYYRVFPSSSHPQEKLRVMAQRRTFSTYKDNERNSTSTDSSKDIDVVENTHDDKHDHSHTHSLFGHSHSHSNGNENGHIHGTEIIAALEGQGDRGSRITIIGLISNVGLTAAKGLAGWYMHSASLLADAGHSLSDLLGDFVTLFCWRLSRKPPSEKYPYGFAKIETVGTSVVSILLIGGALGIGFHSYHLLMAALSNSAASLPASPLQEILTTVTSIAPTAPIVGHGHVHAVDPNAAWFAAISVLIKESLYRATKVVADQEKSPVLLANAIHHRSDAYSSLVAFFAILGTWFFPALPLDPIGGLLVSFVILRQGLDLLWGAWHDLTDAGLAPQTRRSIERKLKPLLRSTAPTSPLIGVHNLRARRSGSMLFVDLTAIVPATMTVRETSHLDDQISQTLKEARKEIAEVRVSFKPSE